MARGRLTLSAAASRYTEEPAPATDPFDLTRRERQGLKRVAEGETNRQIGETLFISEKIISVHVSRILTKLGVSGRTEVAAVARRLGLVAPAPSSDGLGRPSA